MIRFQMLATRLVVRIANLARSLMTNAGTDHLYKRAADLEGIMKSAAPRHPRLSLNHNAYRALCEQALKRWLAQLSGNCADQKIGESENF